MFGRISSPGLHRQSPRVQSFRGSFRESDCRASRQATSDSQEDETPGSPEDNDMRASRPAACGAYGDDDAKENRWDSCSSPPEEFRQIMTRQAAKSISKTAWKPIQKKGDRPNLVATISHTAARAALRKLREDALNRSRVRVHVCTLVISSMQRVVASSGRRCTT